MCIFDMMFIRLFQISSRTYLELTVQTYIEERDSREYQYTVCIYSDKHVISELE